MKSMGFEWDGKVSISQIIAVISVIATMAFTFTKMDQQNIQQDINIAELKGLFKQLSETQKQNEINTARITQIIEDIKQDRKK